MKPILATLTALLLAGCGADTTVPPPAPAAPLTGSTVSLTPEEVDETFVSVVRAGTPGAEILTDDEILEAAQIFCDTMDDVGVEAVYWEVLYEASESDYSDELVNLFGVIIGAAIPAYCPWHGPEMRELTGG